MWFAPAENPQGTCREPGFDSLHLHQSKKRARQVALSILTSDQTGGGHTQWPPPFSYPRILTYQSIRDILLDVKANANLGTELP
ncbi:hypothetical protein LCGC14_1124600, partial [marine sediment metagenome]